MIIDLTGQVALITGGTSGIGAATARQLVASGAKVVVVGIDEELGAALATELNTNSKQLMFLPVDVTDASALADACNKTVEEFGQLNIMMNNAGRGSLGETPDIPIEEWQAVVELNLNAVFYGCRAAIPHMKRIGGGCIINTASLSGTRADHGFSAYNAAKAGVINYTRALALDHGKDNIRANAICPGWINTPLTEMIKDIDPLAAAWNKAIPLGRAGSATEVANLACFLASPLASYITGAQMLVDGGLGVSNGQPNIAHILSTL
ncbi:MAG: meso-butanediol dehydrogenase/(S,S)-butanediol dehydrogenase/diacetyl reductase [Flavobacteriales bacterium]|jgi:meso-butanediol dehydrogenase/(S,S)-butanediol dehydrogenase/diacetyl reductase